MHRKNTPPPPSRPPAHSPRFHVARAVERSNTPRASPLHLHLGRPPHSLNAPAPWLMRRTSHSSLRGGKSASTTSLSVPGVGTGAGVGPGGGGSGGNGVGGAAAPVASVTVVFAEGTGAPPSLSAEESVGMLAGLTASPSSSSSASASTSSPRALDKRPATREEEDGLPPIMRITDHFPGEGLPGGSATGSTAGQMGVTTSGAPPSTATDVSTSTNAIQVQVQEQDDDADSAIGLSESPTFTASPLPLPLSPAEDVQPEPTPSIPIPITVTPPAPLEPEIALSPPPLPSPPILPAAYTSSTPGSTPRKRSWFYISRSASASASASNSSLVGTSPPVATSPLSRAVVGSEPLIARVLPVPVLPGVGLHGQSGVEVNVGALEEEVSHPPAVSPVGATEFDALSPSVSKQAEAREGEQVGSKLGDPKEKEKEKEREGESEKEVQAKSYPSSIDDFVPPLPQTPAVEVPNVNVEGVLELEDGGKDKERMRGVQMREGGGSLGLPFLGRGRKGRRTIGVGSWRNMGASTKSDFRFGFGFGVWLSLSTSAGGMRGVVGLGAYARDVTLRSWAVRCELGIPRKGTREFQSQSTRDGGEETTGAKAVGRHTTSAVKMWPPGPKAMSARRKPPNSPLLRQVLRLRRRELGLATGRSLTVDISARREGGSEKGASPQLYPGVARVTSPHSSQQALQS
ncbi:hypothetical protein DFP72DRAFT_860394 [Ephemerocybe angulata]|uniref:Uncharacterized protein n=1 Tax=Ephemerocybe angulata TaxID=980116 RepID=A0A8H6HAH5_9AGAR|nr:hypothetical protein DFP72DRAFT_860394 [Tulosesus angulatus]